MSTDASVKSAFIIITIGYIAWTIMNRNGVDSGGE